MFVKGVKRGLITNIKSNYSNDMRFDVFWSFLSLPVILVFQHDPAVIKVHREYTKNRAWWQNYLQGQDLHVWLKYSGETVFCKNQYLIHTNCSRVIHLKLRWKTRHNYMFALRAKLKWYSACNFPMNFENPAVESPLIMWWVYHSCQTIGNYFRNYSFQSCWGILPLHSMRRCTRIHAASIWPLFTCVLTTAL